MDYISPERSLEGTCGDPDPLFVDQDGSLLEHMDYHGEGVPQHESPPPNEGLLVDPSNQMSYLDADSLPFMNDQIPCNAMKSASTSPASPLKQAQEHHVHIESDMQNDAAEQNVHNGDTEAQTTPVGYDVHQKTEVVDAVLPPELHESSGNDTSNFQQETRHSNAYLGDSMLTENSSRDYQSKNSGSDDYEIPNSSALQMENEDIRQLHETSHNEKDGIEDNQMNGRNSSSRDERDKENFNSAIAPSYLEGMEQENLITKNGISTPGNQWDSHYERSPRLEKGTPSPGKRVSLPVERSPHAHSSGKLESQRPSKEVSELARSQSPPARCLSRSPEKPDTNRRRASSRELTPHVRQNSPPEKKARKESRHGDGSPRRRSASPRRRASPKRRSSPRRRDSPPRDSQPRRRDSPRRRDRSKSRSPSRKTDTSRHRREHGRSRSRSPHSMYHHRRSPRRRHSPRRRSPPSSHRHHSPRRPWSPPANRKTGLGKPGRNLFVAGFSYATTERDLDKKFSRFGRVTSARVVRDKRSGDSRGFGFLSLERDEDADAAIRACDETEWNGRIILVEKSKAPSW